MASENSNDFQLVASETRACELGSDYTVSCHLSPAINAVAMEIRWYKETDCICLYKNSEVTKGRSYKGRVSLSTQELESGNVSLQVRNIRWSDIGDYLCQVTSGGRTREVTVGLRRVDHDVQLASQVFQNRSVPIKLTKINRTWTEEERMKMKESSLMTEFKVNNVKDLHQKMIHAMQGQNRELEQTKLLLKESKMDFDRILKQLESKNCQLNDKNKELEVNHKIQVEMKKQLDELQTKLDNTQKTLTEINCAFLDNEKHLYMKVTHIQELEKQLLEIKKNAEEKQIQLEKKNIELENMSKLMVEKERLLENTVKEMETSKHQLETLRNELQDKSSQLQEMKILLEEKEQQLHKAAQGEITYTKTPLIRKESRQHPPDISGETISQPRLVLLGRTGSGKNAAGNIILGREERSQTGTSTETQQSESRQGEVAGRQVTVVDTPDWFCSGLSLEKVRQDVELCFRLSAPGPHAFLLVIPVKQSTGEERGMLEKMEEIFGERCWKNTMILFTLTDKEHEKNIEEFVQSGNQELQRLVEICGNRFHCLNINQSGDGSQVSELLEKIEKMEAGNTERFYSSEIYLEIQQMEKRLVREREKLKERQEREIREKLEREVREALCRFSNIIKGLEDCISQHEERIAKLERKIKEEKDEHKRRELERMQGLEIHLRRKFQNELTEFRKKWEREKGEMEERHRQEMEEIREMYERDAKMEAERNFMKIILPDLQQTVCDLVATKQKDFDIKMEEKDRELEILKQKLSEAHRATQRGGERRREADTQNETSGVFGRLMWTLLWSTPSDPVINTDPD